MTKKDKKKLFASDIIISSWSKFAIQTLNTSQHNQYCEPSYFPWSTTKPYTMELDSMHYYEKQRACKQASIRLTVSSHVFPLLPLTLFTHFNNNMFPNILVFTLDIGSNRMVTKAQNMSQDTCDSKLLKDPQRQRETERKEGVYNVTLIEFQLEMALHIRPTGMLLRNEHVGPVIGPARILFIRVSLCGCLLLLLSFGTSSSRHSSSRTLLSPSFCSLLCLRISFTTSDSQQQQRLANRKRRDRSLGCVRRKPARASAADLSLPPLKKSAESPGNLEGIWQLPKHQDKRVQFQHRMVQFLHKMGQFLHRMAHKDHIIGHFQPTIMHTREHRMGQFLHRIVH